MYLSTKEKIRYSRHLNLPQFGIATQEKLKEAKVLVVGAGGLGAPLLQYLTAVGVGTIGIVDFDLVDESNLQRQVLFGTSDVGLPKTDIAIKKLQDQNPNVTFHEYNKKLDAKNALSIIEQYDVVADGSDNFPTRYLVNDACVIAGKPNVYASIFQFEGQVSVFNYRKENGDIGPNYRDLFPTPPPPGSVPSCADGGVLGVLPGIIGSMQASEVIKVITGIGQSLAGRLFLFDALDFSTRTLNVKKNPNTPTITQLIDYDEFCGINSDQLSIKAIQVEELNNWMLQNKKLELIDVREAYEYEEGNLGGKLIPTGQIKKRLQEIPKNIDVVLHCKSGSRSASAIKLLQEKHGYTNLYNLDGGILAWKEYIDSEITVI